MSKTVFAQVCNTVNEQQCNTVQEQQCRTVQDTVNEQVTNIFLIWIFNTDVKQHLTFFCPGLRHSERTTVQHCARTTMFHSQWAGFSSSLSRILLIFSLFRFATLCKTQFKNKSAQRFRNKFATPSALRSATRSTRRLKYTKIHFSTCEQQSEDA